MKINVTAGWREAEVIPNLVSSMHVFTYCAYVWERTPDVYSHLVVTCTFIGVALFLLILGCTSWERHAFELPSLRRFRLPLFSVSHPTPDAKTHLH